MKTKTCKICKYLPAESDLLQWNLVNDRLEEETSLSLKGVVLEETDCNNIGTV